MDINTNGFSHQLLNIRIGLPETTDVPADANQKQSSAEDINQNIFKRQSTQAGINKVGRAHSFKADKTMSSRPEIQPQGLIITQRKDIASAVFQQITDLDADIGNIIDTYA